MDTKKHSRMLAAAIFATAAYGVMGGSPSMAGIVEVINGTQTITDHTYTLIEDDKTPFSTTGATSLGEMNVDSNVLSLIGNTAANEISGEYTDDSSQHATGITVGYGDNFTIDGISLKNFSGPAITNSGTSNIIGRTGITFSGNTTDINNTSVLNIIGGNTTLNAGISSTNNNVQGTTNIGSDESTDPAATLILGDSATLQQASLNIKTTGTLDATAAQLNQIGDDSITNFGTLNLKGGEALSKDINYSNDTLSNNGRFNLVENVTIDDDHKLGAETLDLNGKTLTLSSGSEVSTDVLYNDTAATITGGQTANGSLTINNNTHSIESIANVNITNVDNITLKQSGDYGFYADASKITGTGSAITLDGAELTLVGASNTNSFTDGTSDGSVIIASTMNNTGVFSNHALTIKGVEEEDNPDTTEVDETVPALFTTNADLLQTETAVVNDGMLYLTGSGDNGTLSTNITGYGTTDIAGDIVAQGSIGQDIALLGDMYSLEIAANGVGGDITNPSGTNSVTLHGDYDATMNDNAGGWGATTVDSFDHSITGSGSVNISNELNITLGDTSRIEGAVTNDGTLTASFGDSTQQGATGIVGSLTNNNQFNLIGDLTKDIAGDNGTTTLEAGEEVAVVGSRTIDGTLNMNGATLNMQDADLSNADPANVYPSTSNPSFSTLNVGALQGSGNLKIDVNMATNASGIATDNDRLFISNDSTGASINVTSVNIVDSADITNGKHDAYVQYAAGTGNGGGVTYSVENGAIGTITSDNHRYVFTNSETRNGSLDVYVRGDEIATLADFIQGGVEEDINDNPEDITFTTYSLVDDYTTTEDLGTMGTYTPAPTGGYQSELNLNLNGHTLSAEGGVQNVEFAVEAGADDPYANDAAYYLAEEDQVTGDKTYYHIINDDPQNPEYETEGVNTLAGATVANDYTLNVNGGDTQGTVSGFTTAFTVAGETTEDDPATTDVDESTNDQGTLNIDDVTFTGNDVDIANDGEVNFTGTNVVNTMTGDGDTNIISGTVTVAGAADNAISQGSINNSGTLIANANVFDVEDGITNSSLVELTGGTLDTEINADSDIYTGAVVISGDVTNTSGNEMSGANLSINGAVYNDDDPPAVTTPAASLTSDAGDLDFQLIDNDGTLTLGGAVTEDESVTSGLLTSAISGNGTTVIDGDVVSTVSIDNDITINSDKSLEIEAENVDGDVSNEAGTLILAGSDDVENPSVLENKVTGEGKTEIEVGYVKNASENEIENDIAIDEDATFESDWDDLTSENNIVNDGYFIVNGDVEFTGDSKTITTTDSEDKGVTVFNDEVVNNGATVTNNIVVEDSFYNGATVDEDTEEITATSGTIDGDVIVDSDAELLNDGIITGQVTNNGGAITNGIEGESDNPQAVTDAEIQGGLNNIQGTVINGGTVKGEVSNGSNGYILNGIVPDSDESVKVLDGASIVADGIENSGVIANAANIELTDGTALNNSGDLLNGSMDGLSDAPLPDIVAEDAKITGDVVNTGRVFNNGEIEGDVTNTEGGLFFNGVAYDKETDNFVSDGQGTVSGDVTVENNSGFINGGEITGENLTVSNGGQLTNGVAGASGVTLEDAYIDVENVQIDDGTINNAEVIDAGTINVGGTPVMEDVYNDVPVEYTEDEIPQGDNSYIAQYEDDGQTPLTNEDGDQIYYHVDDTDPSGFETTQVPSMVQATDENGDPITQDVVDADGNPVYVQATDENGDPVTTFVPTEYTVEPEATADPYANNDEYELIATNDDGSKVYYKKDDSSDNQYEGTEEPVYEIEQEPVMVQEQTPKLDNNGDPITTGGTLRNVATEVPATNDDGTPIMVQDTDEEGNPLFDEDGNPVMVQDTEIVQGEIYADEINVGENGNVINEGGYIETAENINNEGDFINNGGDVVAGGDINNDGLFVNQDGDVEVDGNVVNNGDFYNNGGDTTVNGEIDNDGLLVSQNGGEVTADDGIVNDGTLVSSNSDVNADVTNSGDVYVTDGGAVNGDITNQAPETPNDEPATVVLEDGTVNGDVTGGEGELIAREGDNAVNGAVDVEQLTMNGGNLYVADTLNSDALESNGGTLDLQNGTETTSPIGEATLNETMDYLIDANLKDRTVDALNGSYNAEDSDPNATINIAGINLTDDTKTAGRTSLDMFNGDEESRAALKDHLSAGDLRDFLVNPIFKYSGSYNKNDGFLNIDKRFNPAVLVGPVATQMGGYLTQLNSYDEAFRNMDMYMIMTSKQRQALKFRNKIASLNGGVGYDTTVTPIDNAAGWLRPYMTYENVHMHNGPKVENTAYGSFFGGESEMKDLGNGWDGMWGAYVGYNGSHQSYEDVGIYQNGGTLGAVGMAYKNNYFVGATINVGANAGEGHTKYGHEHFSMLMSGIAAKTGYNWELADGKFIIQPNLLMSYSFVNTFDYTNAAGVRIDSDPLHAIQVEPGLKFIGNLGHGWQPYAGISVVINIMDRTHFMANDISLPNMSINPFVKYGLGVRKTWGDRFTGYLQTFFTSGGRSGIGVQGGFRWAIGAEGSGHITKNAPAPQMKKTTVNLQNHKASL